MTVKQIFHLIRARWRLLLLVLIPLAVLPLPLIENSSPAKCAYIVIIISGYWIFEVLPLPVTSILPLFLFPMAGVLKASEVAPQYFQDSIALFFGSLSLAHSIETVNLHRRIALFVLSRIGSSPKWTMAGLMIVTAFLSMWINNSAAASIMLPVALAIAGELERDHENSNEHQISNINGFPLGIGFESDSAALRKINGEKDDIENPVPIEIRVTPNATPQIVKNENRIQKGFLLSIAYSATIGGLSTLVGTGTNVFAKGFIEKEYKNTNFSVSFSNFLQFALPVAVIMLIFCWLWLQILFNRNEFFQCRVDVKQREIQRELKKLLVEKYRELGGWSWSEISVGIVFLSMVILWVTKDFSTTPGWDIIFVENYTSDSTVAVFCGILPMILPNANPFQKNWKYKPIVLWNDLSRNLSWGTLLLLGAGLSIARAFQVSGLTETIAKRLEFLSAVPEILMILIVIVISGLFTEVTSNLSTVSIFLPVLNSVAQSSKIHPGLLVLPCTLSVSLAFMLPIATPPNAIVFSSGNVRIIDMIKTGIVMNLIGFSTVFVASISWMRKIYNLNEQTTAEFYRSNSTSTIRSFIKN